MTAPPPTGPLHPAPDLHPDELLERARTQLLSASERARLDTHLAACVACRFLTAASADFARATPGVGRHEIARVVSRAIAATGGRAIPAPARRWRAVAFGVAGSFVLMGVASARWWAPALSPPPPPESRAVGAAAPRRMPRAARVVRDPVTAPPDLEPTPAPSPPRPLLPATAAPAMLPEGEAPTAPALFAQATTARRRGQEHEARVAYERLWARFRHSPEARASRLACGRWLLDRGENALAATHFRQYLAGGPGELEEESLVGLALASSRLGRAADEGAAWNRLVADHPTSAHGSYARRRLAALGEDPP